MVFPAVAAGAAKLLAIPGLKEVALTSATRIATDLYGRVMGAKSEDAAPPSATVAELVADLPTREELVASFAVLQAELDRRHRRATALIVVVLFTQALSLGVIILRT
jgi:hypothetical protein